MLLIIFLLLFSIGLLFKLFSLYLYLLNLSPQKNRKLSQNLPISVLLVDDLELNRKVSKILLAPYTQHIDVAHNGMEAVVMASNKQYDIIFTDIKMPLLDGLSATRKIRKLPGFENTPIIGVSDSATVDECRDAGMNFMLKKPLKKADLPTVLCVHGLLTVI